MPNYIFSYKIEAVDEFSSFAGKLDIEDIIEVEITNSKSFESVEEQFKAMSLAIKKIYEKYKTYYQDFVIKDIHFITLRYKKERI